MASNFNANQFESAFIPKKLGNWEIPKGKSDRPKTRRGNTQVIVNDKGHILPGIQKSNKNPWAGLYCGTYNLPKRITRKFLEKMEERKIRKREENKESKKDRNNSYPESVISDKENRNAAINDQNIESKEINNNKTSGNKKSRKSNDSVRGMEATSTKFENDYEQGPILSKSYSNGLIAKALKKEFQKHHALPDTVDNEEYKALQMQRKDYPGLSLSPPENPMIACKLYDSPGPTQCSKLKVFRPKTAVNKEKTPIEDNKRPKTTSKIRKKVAPLTEMDLAIYWDITPEAAGFPSLETNIAPAVFETVHPKDDYQKQVTDQEVPSLKSSCSSQGIKPCKGKRRFLNKTNNTSAIMDIVNFETSRSRSSVSSRGSSDLQDQNSKISINSDGSEKSVQVDNIPRDNAKSEKCSNSGLGIKKRYKSSPNLVSIGIQTNNKEINNKRNLCRPCVACEIKKDLLKPTCAKFEYKMAFKAGNPNNLQLSQDTLERMRKSKSLRVPKPKIPFARKSYSIGTLVPPFSVWAKAPGYDYPDHWRLASVYQHSYKPIESRRNQLIKTIFN